MRSEEKKEIGAIAVTWSINDVYIFDLAFCFERYRLCSFDM